MIYTFEKGMHVELGVGWDPQNPSSNKKITGCFVPPELDLNSNPPSASDTYSQSFSDSFSEFQRKTTFSLDVSGKGTLGVFKASGKASYSKHREIFRSNRNIVWTISCKRVYEPVSIRKLELTPEGETLLARIEKSNDFQTLRKRVGSQLITSVSKTIEIHVVYVFTVSKSSLIQDVKAEISAAASNAAASGSVKTSIVEHLKTVDEAIKLDTDVLHYGITDNSTSFAQLGTAAPGDLGHVRQLLGQAISEMSWNSAKILEFTAEPLSSFFDVPELPFDDDVFGSRISRLQSIQADVVSRYLELDDLLQQDAQHVLTLKDDAEKEIDDEIKLLDTSFDQIEEQIKELRKDPTTNKFSVFPSIKINSRKLHWVKLDFGKFNEWECKVRGNRYNDHSERIKAKADYWPVFSIRNPDLIKQIELMRNDVTVTVLVQSELISTIENGVISLEKYYRSTHQMSEPCWRGHWGEVCNPWAADTRRLSNELKYREAGFDYKLIVVDIENGIHEIPIVNPSSQAF